MTIKSLGLYRTC